MGWGGSFVRRLRRFPQIFLESVRELGVGNLWTFLSHSHPWYPRDPRLRISRQATRLPYNLQRPLIVRQGAPRS